MTTEDLTRNPQAPSLESTEMGFAQKSREAVANPVHTLGLLAILAIWAYLGRLNAIHMRTETAPNHLMFYGRTLIFEWFVFGYIAFGIRARGVSLRELIGPRWTNSRVFFRDVGIAAAFEGASFIILGAVSVLIHANTGSQSVRFMMPVGVFEMILWVFLSVTAGICEETIFRGYLQRQFIGWTGNAVIGVALSGAIFGACHIYQGGKHAIIIAIYGCMFGTLALLRRSLKPGMLAHGFQDSAAGILFSLAIKYKLGGV
jgi:membrane protease YdiL (CAAX protease family)